MVYAGWRGEKARASVRERKREGTKQDDGLRRSCGTIDRKISPTGLFAPFIGQASARGRAKRYQEPGINARMQRTIKCI